MSSEPPQPTFDPQVVRDLLEMFGDPALVVKVIRLFLEEAPKQVDAVAQGVSHGVLQEVRRSAHTLKSSAASVGAKHLSELSARVEELTKAQRMDDVLPLVEPLRSSLDQVREILATEAARLAPSSGSGGSVGPPTIE